MLLCFFVVMYHTLKAFTDSMHKIDSETLILHPSSPFALSAGIYRLIL